MTTIPRPFMRRGPAPKGGGWLRAKPRGAAEAIRRRSAGRSGHLRLLEPHAELDAGGDLLAHALTEPSLASVQVSAERADRIEALAAIPERRCRLAFSPNPNGPLSAAITDRMPRVA